MLAFEAVHWFIRCTTSHPRYTTVMMAAASAYHDSGGFVSSFTSVGVIMVSVSFQMAGMGPQQPGRSRGGEAIDHCL